LVTSRKGARQPRAQSKKTRTSVTKRRAKLVEVSGSQRHPLPAAKTVGPAADGQRAEVTVLLRRPSGAAARRSARRGTRVLSIEELEAQQGAAAKDVKAVQAFARTHHLTVVRVDAGRRMVVLGGTLGLLSKAFATKLMVQEAPSGTFRTRSGALYVPKELGSIVEGVFGLDDRPAATPKLRRRGTHSAGTSYTPTQVAAAYAFPEGADGTGQCIALLELGGGFRPADLQSYFSSLGITLLPSVVAVGVDGATNSPGDPNGPDGEVMLDIEVAGSVAPRASVVVFFAPNTDRGFLDGLVSALHDKTHRPSVVSISWGGPEANWTPQALDGLNGALQDAATLGVTVCVAAGDGGSSDGAADSLAHVDFPASSPFALACGGTRLSLRDGVTSTETVWNDGTEGGATGGGVSDYFALPAWQKQAGVPPSVNAGHSAGRGVPDVAGNADPATGYQVLVDGESAVIGGTSAVAPLVAGLVALLNQKLGSPIGYLNPTLYTTQALSSAFRDVTQGNNGAYTAGPGWDACTGWGSPNGAKLLAALGTPGTPGKKRKR
jgi:kumamolisin